jgi:hypothetical protein
LKCPAAVKKDELALQRRAIAMAKPALKHAYGQLASTALKKKKP